MSEHEEKKVVAEASSAVEGAIVHTGSAVEPDEDEAPPRLDHPPLRDTGNGPSVSYEEALLEEFYGAPDADGVYGKGATNG